MKIKVNKKILLLVVLIGVISGLTYGIWLKVVGERYKGNLLSNFNFEIVDTSGKLQSWTEDPRGGWSVNIEEPYEGKRCMEATVAWSWLTQDVRVESKRYYLLKAYVRSDITIPGEIKGEDTFLTLECLDWKGNLIRRDYGIVSATSSWEEKIRQIYAPKGIKKVRVRLAKRQGEGSVWFDRLELKQLPLISVFNPSFEILDKLGKPKHWKEDPLGGWSVDIEGSYEGKRCMQATVGWSWLSQEIPVRSKRYYTLSAYMKSDFAFSEEEKKEEEWNVFLALECLDKEYKVITEQKTPLKATSLWQLGKIGLYAPENTYKIRVKLANRLGEEGDVWFDNLKITESAWYMKIKFLRRIAQDKPFFIFYFSIYFILLIFLLRLILKRESSSKEKR